MQETHYAHSYSCTLITIVVGEFSTGNPGCRPQKTEIAMIRTLYSIHLHNLQNFNDARTMRKKCLANSLSIIIIVIVLSKRCR